MRPAVSIVLPIYNESSVLKRNLEALIEHMQALGRAFDVVCVDDGSSDDSLAILERMALADGRIKPSSLGTNQGKGAAVRTGMLLAEGELIIFMDADLSTPLSEVTGFLGALDSGYDVVIGNRRAPGSQITRHQPWIRETLGKGFTNLTNLLLAPGVRDFTCGFKGFRHAASQTIFERSTLNGWAFDAELVVIAQEQGLKLAQVPVEWHDEEGTKVRILQAVFGSLGDLCVILFRRLGGRYR
jgi:dolichyl-phosphate beta-glucosyltransferase